MGCLISFFKKLFQRIKSPKRDRWIRDDKRTLLPVVIDPKKRPNYGAIPKRIEQQVIVEFVSQDLSRRLPNDEVDFNMYDDIHQRLMGTRFQLQEECCASSDSIVGPVGNEEIKSSLCPMAEKKNESDATNNEVLIVDSSGSSWRDMGESEEADTGNDVDMVEEMSLLFGRIPEDVRQVMSGGGDYRDIQQLIAEYRQKMAEEAGQPDGEEQPVDDAVPASFQLERYRVVVHSFDSGDASWIKWVGS